MKTIKAAGKPWNKYILYVNKEIIKLDNDPEEQLNYIFKAFHEMSKNPEYNQEVIVNWFNSQMILTKNNKYVGIFDYSALYTSKLDLSVLLKHHIL